MDQGAQLSARGDGVAPSSAPRPGEDEAESAAPAFIRWVPLAIPLAALTLLACAAIILANAE
jgi:hypothetical protein